MFEELINKYLPIPIHIFELMGIIVISIGAFTAFYHYLKSLIDKKHFPIKYQFANSMALGLEFKLSAEILKTVLIRTFMELAIIGSIILLRLFMTVIINWEMKQEKKENNS
ncbi:DUF1622 domain-containing protein [Clostridium botulinum]|uniref:DUF1622 domain-containing protein n=2 Tax=Clostridium botulinum TaxID=1491 RepID=A0A0C2SES9_CLOBO|nr:MULTISPECIES: DUF1622 domain-containing protein [Clostridium]ACD54143.1 conserved hypothetical protein [Clostridium botulinum E3 str. Alaska E43]AJF30505.1 hypothetical protein ST13_12605 [Clostridium botulinum]AJF33568.1 hypothetical protein ST12_12605 [Clostridium botulinum]KAI3349887.1 DUF1622 domain-containing protein [Clostridium botulinum]KIL07746.1 hypothetical protein SR42_01470 [Clostridium botulinum]